MLTLLDSKTSTEACSIGFDHDLDSLPAEGESSGHATLLTVVRQRLFEPFVPTPRDLLHLYGPDRANIKDWKQYYRCVESLRAAG